ncbi:hypothetical protein WJX81_000747 [Elliptochloris bilobata]|uniref:Uncharacterized protein n=1 Tax=Elliptochloris bilobata TaxID=381761 RepID=A0AAW1QKG0_9CHLO
MLGRPCLVHLQLVLALLSYVRVSAVNSSATTTAEVWKGVGFASAHSGNETSSVLCTPLRSTQNVTLYDAASTQTLTSICTLAQAPRMPLQAGIGGAAAQLAVSAATVAVNVESLAVSTSAAALQQTCEPAGIVAGADISAQCVGPMYVLEMSGGECMEDAASGRVACSQPAVTITKRAGGCNLPYTGPSLVQDASCSSSRAVMGSAASGVFVASNTLDVQAIFQLPDLLSPDFAFFGGTANASAAATTSTTANESAGAASSDLGPAAGPSPAASVHMGSLAGAAAPAVGSQAAVQAAVSTSAALWAGVGFASVQAGNATASVLCTPLRRNQSASALDTASGQQLLTTCSVTDVVQEFVAGLPNEAAAAGAYLRHQAGVASGLASEAAATASAAAAAVLADAAALGSSVAASLSDGASGLGRDAEAAAAAAISGAAHAAARVAAGQLPSSPFAALQLGGALAQVAATFSGSLSGVKLPAATACAPALLLTSAAVPSQCTGPVYTLEVSGGQCKEDAHSGHVTCTQPAVMLTKAAGGCSFAYTGPSVMQDASCVSSTTFGAPASGTLLASNTLDVAASFQVPDPLSPDFMPFSAPVLLHSAHTL